MVLPDNFLFESAVNISKAHAYDIVCEQVIKLKQIVKDLIEKGDLDGLEFTDQKSTDDFKATLRTAKILSL